jgi:hypothetical protein
MNLFIAASVLSSLILVVSAGTKDDGEMVLARLAIHGLPNELTSQDIDMIYQAVAPPPSISPTKPSLRATVIAVPDDHEADEEDETTSLLRKSAPAPPPRGYSCGGWGCGGWDPRNPQHQRSRWWGFGPDYSCGPLCDNDDAMVASTTMATVLVTVPASTRASDLCAQFQTSTSSVLSQAQHCSLSIMEDPSVASLCVDGTQVGEALVFVDGLAHDAVWTPDAAEVLAHSVLAAYNQVYASHHALTSFTALNAAPGNAETASTVVMGEFHRTCTRAAPDHDPRDAQVAFEERLCGELRESGAPLFAAAEHCAFRTLRSPPVMEKSATAVDQ